MDESDLFEAHGPASLRGRRRLIKNPFRKVDDEFYVSLIVRLLVEEDGGAIARVSGSHVQAWNNCYVLPLLFRCRLSLELSGRQLLSAGD